MEFETPITTEEVKGISATSISDIAPFLCTANLVVDEKLSDKDLSTNTLRAITLYLTAHFAFIQEGQVKSEKIGASSTTFNMATGLSLKSTTFGQQAMFLDFSGTLATLNAAATSDEEKREGAIEFL